jgi:hypothetical protein
LRVTGLPKDLKSLTIKIVIFTSGHALKREIRNVAEAAGESGNVPSDQSRSRPGV